MQELYKKLWGLLTIILPVNLFMTISGTVVFKKTDINTSSYSYEIHIYFIFARNKIFPYNQFF